MLEFGKLATTDHNTRCGDIKERGKLTRGMLLPPLGDKWRFNDPCISGGSGHFKIFKLVEAHRFISSRFRASGAKTRKQQAQQLPNPANLPWAKNERRVEKAPSKKWQFGKVDGSK